VESKWKNYHITTFSGQSLSPKNMRDALSGVKLKIALFGELSLEVAMNLSGDRQILELTGNAFCCYCQPTTEFIITGSKVNWKHRDLADEDQIGAEL
jgi:hypothetical protein